MQQHPFVARGFIIAGGAVALFLALAAVLAVSILFSPVPSASAQIAVTSPSVPTGLAVTAVPPSQISLSWSASTESSGTIAGYYIYRNGVRITSTAGTSLTDSGLSPGFYQYTIAAYDVIGNISSQSSAASTSLIPDTTPPSVPAGVSISGTTSTDNAYILMPLTISWGASTDNIGVAGYYVYRNNMQIVTSTTAFTGTSYTDWVPAGTYSYSVVAYDAAQNVSNHSAPVSVTISVDNMAPSMPTGLVAQQVSSGGVNLTWASSTDNIGVAGYQVHRDGTQIASVTGPAYADSGLSSGVTYAYTVTAFDVAGNVSAQSTPPASVLVQPTSGVNAPVLAAAMLVGTSTVRLSWAASGDVLPISSYAIYRNGTQIATVGATSTSYVDAGLAPNATYAYTLTATDISGAVSPMSSLVNAMLPALVAEPTVAPTPTVVVATSTPAVMVSTTTAPAVPAAPTITQSLYVGLRSPQVMSLQTILVANGYLSANATGYFGTLTLAAVEKFQCAESIVCTGDAGWGLVGPKTRAALNALAGAGTASAPSVPASAATTPTPSSLAAELQTLEAELAALEAQAH